MDKDVILTPEQIAAEERRWLFDAPIAELAEYYIQNEGLAQQKVTDECSEMEERSGLHEEN